ncbi:MAG TPA: hypothetical protein VJQ85_07600 [Gaiellaceae bacterium]|nr:hypothetical protein [Gaiellaceae bacterium]
MKTALVALAAAAALGVAGATVAHAFQARGTTLALPELHGQVTWAPGMRPSPVTVPRGRVALVAYVATRCKDCAAELRFTIDQLPARFRPVVVRRVASGKSLLLLVDKRGDVRTGYTFPFAPAFVEGDLRTLAR